MFKTALYWFALVLVAMPAAFLYFERSLLSDMAVFIWILSGIVVLYRAKKCGNKGLTPVQRKVLVLFGAFMAAFSFINQIFSFLGFDVVFWNPPYSIGEFGVLFCGLSIMYFALLGSRPLILPAAFPGIVLSVYQLYELYESNIEWIAAPLLDPTTELSVFVLNLLGVGAAWNNEYVISFLSRDGVPMGVRIVIDCTGIWSLSAFTASIILVSLAFPRVFSRKGFLYIAVGYIGTYAANILRVVAICLSAYLYGHSGATIDTHLHAGWIAFSGWMLIFWYFFFARYLLKEPAGKALQAKDEGDKAKV
ncbi:MAG: exosortase/archaeosortase family protein [Candidatus Altiarchaeota archaeon]|nr:exosortase/archaeosortase family protein [Candidatus Altiarchaeota archaeon]